MPPTRGAVLMEAIERAKAKARRRLTATLRDKSAIAARFTEEECAMATEDRIYFARRAAEEQERAAAASNPTSRKAHRKLQRAYLERASVGDRIEVKPEQIG